MSQNSIPSMSGPTPAQWNKIKTVISQNVSWENFTLLFPTENETMDFFANMPDIETIRKTAKDNMTEANTPRTQEMRAGGKRKMLASEDDLDSYKPASKKNIVSRVVPVMQGFSDIPKQVGTGPRRSLSVRAAASAGHIDRTHSSVAFRVGTGLQSDTKNLRPSGSDVAHPSLFGHSGRSLSATPPSGEGVPAGRLPYASQAVSIKPLNAMDASDNFSAGSIEANKKLTSEKEMVAEDPVKQRERLIQIFKYIKSFRQEAIRKNEKRIRVIRRAYEATRVTAEEQKKLYQEIWTAFETALHSREKRDIMIAGYHTHITIPKVAMENAKKMLEVENEKLQKDIEELKEWCKVHAGPAGERLLAKEVASLMFDTSWIEDSMATASDFNWT